MASQPPTSSRGAASNSVNEDIAPGERYGYNFGLTHSGDLNEAPNGTYQVIYDEDTVVQDLKVCLATPKGSDPFRPEYGLNQFEAIGTSDGRLRQEIIRAIGPRQGPPGSGQGDPRVERVTKCEITRPPNDRENTTVDIAVKLIDGTNRSFTFPITRRGPTASGGGQ